MSDNQILIPPSFLELFMDPAKRKLLVSHGEVLARYEWCEDMANMLTETAKEVQFSLGLSEEAVMARMALGLQSPQAACTEQEADWVCLRLAELLSWSAR
jgi:hypothetical protein